MKCTPVSIWQTALLCCLPLCLIAQTDTLSPASEDYEGEWTSYVPEYYAVTNTEGIRLYHNPSPDALVVAVLPIQQRLVLTDSRRDSTFEVRFQDGVMRKGKWISVSVPDQKEQWGWVFSGALNFSYVRLDGPFNTLAYKFFYLERLDSLSFEHRFAAAKSKQKRTGKAVLNSPDGQRGIRKLGARDRMTGLEFIFRGKGNSKQKVTIEDLGGSSALRMAWEGTGVILEWHDKPLGEMEYFYLVLPGIGVD